MKKRAAHTVVKHPSNPLFVEDQPWEARYDNFYGTVLYDTSSAERSYKCWYNPFTQDHSAQGMSLEQRQQEPYWPPRNRQMSVCYATSGVGIHWTKPHLDLIEHNGSTANNIVAKCVPDGAGIYDDKDNPVDADPNRRYKMLMKAKNPSMLKSATSADGVNWSRPDGFQVQVPESCKRYKIGDTHNNFFGDSTRNSYIGITRIWGWDDTHWGFKRRQIGRMETTDFRNWCNWEHEERINLIMAPTAFNKQPYSMICFRHGDVYIGILAVHHQELDPVWPELAWSPDTSEWHRIAENTPLIPLSEEPLGYDYGCIYTCANPVILEHEIRIYYGASDYKHFGWRCGCLALATLRPDGFAGYQVLNSSEPAHLITELLDIGGRIVQLSADIEGDSSIEVLAIDSEDNLVASSEPVTSTCTNAPLVWNRELPCSTVRLHVCRQAGTHADMQAVTTCQQVGMRQTCRYGIGSGSTKAGIQYGRQACRQGSRYTSRPASRQAGK